VKENAKVLALSEEMKSNGGVWPGIVSLGMIGRDTYLIDGQHRRHAFLLSGLPEGLTDVRIHSFETMGDMGAEFVNLNSQLVRLNPDDILRGLQGSVDALATIREKCPFVGYDMVRRNGSSPVLSMSVALRCWSGSAPEIPQHSGGSAALLVGTLDSKATGRITDFLNICMAAFGRDAEYYRLWGALNLCICMWTYRRVVLMEGAHGNSRWAKLTPEEFKRCLMALSADRDYVDWLVGRNLGERDRTPCYVRIKKIFIKRMETERGVKISLPQPSWSVGR
jgi:hypothetical protein